MIRVHLVDGTYELFRAFYGAPKQLDPGGREVGGALGLARSLLGLLRNTRVTHVGCAFDTVIESFRNELYAGYKTGEGVDPLLLAQFELTEEITRALGIVVWSMIQHETDDAWATAAARWKKDPRVRQVVICSPDKDFAQCVETKRVVCLNRRSGQVMDEDGVRKKFGVPPSSIPDWLALVGDSADGYPGVQGWGPKSTSTVLARYPHLEDIPPRARDWRVNVRGPERLAANLRQSFDDCRLYRLLATLRTDVDLKEDLEDLEWKGAHREDLEKICGDLGETGLLESVPKWRRS